MTPNARVSSSNMPTVRSLITALLIVTLLIAGSAAFPLQAGGPATIDFIQYWSAWHLMQQGANPYDPQLLAQLQRDLTAGSEQLILSWNPPWTFLLLSPILALPFEHAASAWLSAQLALILVISQITPYCLARTQPPRPLICALATILFFPILNSLKMGQLGVIFATSIALFLYCQKRGALCAAGLSLIPLSFKPHLFALFLIPGVIWLRQLSARERTHFLTGSLGGFALLILTCTLLWPSTIPDWLHALSNKTELEATPGAVHVSHWQTATLVTWIRLAIAHYYSTLVDWPMWGVPLVSFVVCALYFYQRRSVPISWESLTPLLLCLSLGTSSYGWVFDQSVLVVCQLAVVCAAFERLPRGRAVITIASLIIIQTLSIGGSIYFDPPQHSYVWVPWAYAALYACFVTNSTRTARAPFPS